MIAQESSLRSFIIHASWVLSYPLTSDISVSLSAKYISLKISFIGTF